MKMLVLFCVGMGSPPYKVLSSEKQERKLGIKGETLLVGRKKRGREGGRTKRKSMWKTQ